MHIWYALIGWYQDWNNFVSIRHIGLKFRMKVRITLIYKMICNFITEHTCTGLDSFLDKFLTSCNILIFQQNKPKLVMIAFCINTNIAVI